MKSELARVAVLLSGSGEALSGHGDAMVNAADAVQRVLEVRQ
jgi:hypothetical protein